jgi:hypothetical protein
MKRLIIIVILYTIPIYLNGQTRLPLPIVDNKIIFTEVVIVDSIQKDQLYSRTKLWFADNFKSTKDVIQLDDKENGIVLGKGNILKRESGIQPVIKTWKFSVKVQIKDNKYKVDIYDIDYTYEMPGNNIGAKPSEINLDTYFFDQRIYKKDGGLKDVVLKFANETNDNFNFILSSIKKSLSENIKKDEF